MEQDYDRDFPNLRKFGYSRTSNPHYHNCIAYAAGDLQRAWWPDDHPPNSSNYWPPGVPHHEETVAVFTQAFATLGYSPCADGKWEPGYEKVAIYTWRELVRHMARQQANGTWRSKLGGDEDIEHTLEGLEGPCYGKVVAFLKRRIPGTPVPSKPTILDNVYQIIKRFMTRYRKGS